MIASDAKSCSGLVQEISIILIYYIYYLFYVYKAQVLMNLKNSYFLNNAVN